MDLFSWFHFQKRKNKPLPYALYLEANSDGESFNYWGVYENRVVMWGVADPSADPKFHPNTGNLGETALTLKQELESKGYAVCLNIIPPNENRAHGVGQDWDK